MTIASPITGRGLRMLIALGLCAALTACQQGAAQLEQFGSRNMMRFALDKPYERVANTPDTSSNPLQPEPVYGQRFASTVLEDGNTIHRHIRGFETSSTSTDLGIIRQSERSASTVRLSYFRVGPDGIVNDWAAGSVPGSNQRCISHIGGIIQRCETEAAAEQDIADYDAVVTTSSGQSIASWGLPADEPQAAAGSDATGGQQ